MPVINPPYLTIKEEYTAGHGRSTRSNKALTPYSRSQTLVGYFNVNAYCILNKPKQISFSVDKDFKPSLVLGLTVSDTIIKIQNSSHSWRVLLHKYYRLKDHLIGVWSIDIEDGNIYLTKIEDE